MSGRNVISRELADSIRQCLGRKVKLSLKVIVRAELKNDKLENRVLAFSTCRLFVLTTKVPTRVDQHFHYLDIQAIESRKPNQLCLTVCDRNYSFCTTQDESSSHEVDTMVLSLATALKNIFPSVPIKHVIRKIDIQPAKRLQQIDELERATLGGTRDMGPCGGFSDQYACMCDYHALPYRAEVAWDVDTIYLSHDTREIYLHDFDYLEQKDLIPIISALEYNTWFVKFRASHSKLSHEAIERILHVISKSLSLEELFLDNIGAKPEFANKLSLALLSNSNIPLQTLDMSHNPVEDKGLENLSGLVAKLSPVVTGGAAHISNPIGRQAKGLAHLNLGYCGITSKGINLIAHSMSVNKYMCQTLTFLSFAGNSLRDEVNNLYNFLAQPNVLKTLDLSATECAIDAVFGALLRGCTSHLSHLNLSKNTFGGKKSKEMLPSFKQYFTSTLALSNFNLSQCKLPPDALKNVLLGLACNENISGVQLDLSSNLLGLTGGQILESCIHGVHCLASLDVSDNALENQLGPVVMAISKNKSLKKLDISRNLNNIKSKHVSQVMEAIVHMLQEEDCVLESLYINDSRLKMDLHSLLNALGSNRCLQSLDISGNYMGDIGARLLAKALQINSKLQYISYDRNNVTLLGYGDIAYALLSNYTVKFMPFPVHDAMLCMKTAPDRLENVMRKIQDTLYRNVSPMKYSHGQAFRLQQGFLISSTQQQVDRLVLQTGEVARAVKRTALSNSASADSTAGLNTMLQWSDALIQDAENSKQLISHLHDVVLRRDEAGNPIETKLQQISRDLYAVINNYIQDTVESMVRSAQDKCPNVLSEERVVDDIRSVCLTKSQVSNNLINEAIIEQAGSVILNKINEVNLGIASTVSDRVIDEVVDSLSKACKDLQTGEAPRKRAMTGAEMTCRERGSSESSTKSEKSSELNSQGDDTSEKSDPSPLKLEYLNLATPQLASKRKSLHGRKLRPQSVVERAKVAREGNNVVPSIAELTRSASEDQTLVSLSSFVSDTSDLSSVSSLSSCNEQKTLAESLDSVSELPSNSGQLQHLGKARPRRAKTRAPTRPMGRADVLEEDHDISQGVDTFFRPGSATPTTPLVSPDSELSPRLLQFGSTSSVESYPPNAGARTSSDRGSVESLNRSESDSTRDSPKLRNRSDEEEEEKNKTPQENGEEKRSASSLLGKVGAENALKSSPDLSEVKDKDPEETPPGKKTPTAGGLSKLGARGMGSNLLAEMKAKQEKRSSYFAKDEETKESSSNLVGVVKLRSAGFGDNIKSPTNGFARNKSPTNRDTPITQENAAESSPISCNTKPIITGIKPKPPPPLAPKPRPKSSFTPDGRTASESEVGEEGDDITAVTSHRSVRELAKDLAIKGGASPVASDEGGKNKSSSLPRDSIPTVAAGGSPSPSSIQASPFAKGCSEETYGTQAEGKREILSPLHRQTSQKHVLTTDTVIVDDVIDV